MKVIIILSTLICINANLINESIEERSSHYCNPISTIKLEDELLAPPNNFELKKIFIVARHGDRGPHLPLKNLDQLNCDISKSENSNDIKLFQQFLSDTKTYNYTVREDPKCHLDLLTNIGFLQHLKLGQLIGNNYIPRLNLSHSSVNQIKSYSTEISRTRESATAFLYPILKSLGKNYSEEFKKIIETNSQTIFCIKPELCGRNCTEKNSTDSNSTEELDNSVLRKAMKYVEDFGPFLATNKSDLELYKDPRYIGDGLMTYYCHNFTIPCIEDNNHKKSCINTENIREFFSFMGNISLETSKWKKTKNIYLLLTHGFLMNLFSTIESTNSTEKLSLFSGHDDSLSSLLITLDIFDGTFLSFASRIVFESYSNRNTNKNYLRIICNGRDLTGLTEFCNLNANSCLKSGANINLIDSIQFHSYIKHKFESVFKCE